MTAIAVSQPTTGGRGFPTLSLILIVAFAFGVVYGTHAVTKHGQDALDIRRCLDLNGPNQIRKSFDGSTFYLVCLLDDGRTGIEPVDETGYEKSAFVPRDGSWKAVQRYLDQFSTIYKGKLPWLP